MKVTITEEHLKRAEAAVKVGYNNYSCNCLVGQAIKDVLGREVTVGHTRAVQYDKENNKETEYFYPVNITEMIHAFDLHALQVSQGKEGLKFSLPVEFDLADEPFESF